MSFNPRVDFISFLFPQCKQNQSNSFPEVSLLSFSWGEESGSERKKKVSDLGSPLNQPRGQFRSLSFLIIRLTLIDRSPSNVLSRFNSVQLIFLRYHRRKQSMNVSLFPSKGIFWIVISSRTFWAGKLFFCWTLTPLLFFGYESIPENERKSKRDDEERMESSPTQLLSDLASRLGTW